MSRIDLQRLFYRKRSTTQTYFVLLLGLGIGIFSGGCAGTRCCEQILYAGVEQDYLLNPEATLFHADGRYFLQQTRKSYRYRPGWYYLWGIPISFFPNDFTPVPEKSETLEIHEIASDFAQNLQQGKLTLTPSQGSQQSPLQAPLREIPADAEMFPLPQDEFQQMDTITFDACHTCVNGKLLETRKSPESYLLLPLLLPGAVIDVGTFLAWPLSPAVALLLLKGKCF